jgi:hypothetical protein
MVLCLMLCQTRRQRQWVKGYLCEELEIKPNTQMLANVEFTYFRTEMEGSIYHKPALTGYPGVIIAKSVHSLSSKRQLCIDF